MSALFSVSATACLCLAGVFFCCDAEAAGRLSFRGAVVIPTCPVTVSAQSLQGVQLRYRCGSPDANVGTSRNFALHVIHIDGATDDKVLRYFHTYMRASRADAVDPLLVIQTYE